MALTSIKKNFAYKSVLNLSSYLAAFIVFPYTSRIFGPERIGLVNFVDNTVNYFLLFATMGIGLLGVREIAAVKNDERERSRVFANIFGLNMLFTIITFVVYALAVLLIPRLSAHPEMFFIGGAKIIFTALLIEWFFSGMENFRYITLRSIAIRVLYVAAVFLFVRNRDQYVLFFAITTASVIINALINILYVRKFVRPSWRDMLDMRYTRTNLSLGLYSIMTSMYLTLNVVYLGFVAGDTEVGYYTTAFKLNTVMLGLFSAFTNVMLPRMSALVAAGAKEEFQVMINKSFSAVATFSIPLVLCSMAMAPQIIHILAGNGFDGAILPMRIILPAVIMAGIAQVLAIQIIMPLKHDRTLLIASAIGASVSIAINIFIVPHLASIGSAIVLLSAETVVTGTYVVYVLRKKIVKIPFKLFVRSLLLSLPCVAICIACAHFIENPFISLATALVTSVACWSAINFNELRQYLGI